MENTKGFKEFFKYVSQNVLGMLGLSCYILADTFFVAKGMGANGLAALNLALPVLSMVNGIGLMLGMGGGTKYTILKSQNNKQKAKMVFSNVFFVAMLCSVLFVGLGFFASENIAVLLMANTDVFVMSKTYIQVILLFSPMFIANHILLCFVRNDGYPRLAMLAMLGGSISNIILDYIFVFPLDMGIFGAAFATGLAPIISILILSPVFLKRKTSFCLTKCKISPCILGGVFSSGIPSLVIELSSGIVIIVFNTIILGLQGNVGVAAYGIVANISLVVISVYTGVAQGVQPIISRSYGTGNHAYAKTIFRYAVVLVVAISAVIYVGVFLFASQITCIFNSGQDLLLQNIATEGLRIYFVGCVFAGLNIILSVFFTSTEKPLPAHIISLLRGFVVIIPTSFLLSAIWGLTGVWLVFFVTEAIVCGIGICIFCRQRHKQSNI